MCIVFDTAGRPPRQKAKNDTANSYASHRRCLLYDAGGVMFAEESLQADKTA